MKKGITVKPDIKDIIEAFNDAGIKIELGEKETDGIIAYDKDGNKHILREDYTIFDENELSGISVIDQYTCINKNNEAPNHDNDIYIINYISTKETKITESNINNIVFVAA